MYAGGLLATLLILGLLLLILALAVLISEPRNAAAPRTREHPADVTRRLRTQTVRTRRSDGRGDGTKG